MSDEDGGRDLSEPHICILVEEKVQRISDKISIENFILNFYSYLCLIFN